MKYFKAICIFVPLACFIIFLVDPIDLNHQLNNTNLFLSTVDKTTLFAEPETQLIEVKNPPKRKLVIATVACSAKRKDTYIYEEALIMMKSVLISAIQNNVDELDFHVYLEDMQKEDYYLKSFQTFGFSPNDSMVTLYFHSAVNVVPKKYRRHMIYHRRFRCGYVRAFFPMVLTEVDSILYLDTDIIVTGDIYKLWSHLYDMRESQLIGVGYNNEEIDKNYGDLDDRLFGDIPHVKPKGINNGVILMNLTKMRAYGWVEKLLNLYSAYSKVNRRMTVQRLMNILLYYSPDLLYILRCEFHFIHTHCEKGLTCRYIEDDRVDIHVVHGANNTFENDGIFEPIFSAYKKFDMTSEDVLNDLYYPIRSIYNSRENLENPCNRVLAENLYNKIVPNLDLFDGKNNGQ